MPPSQITRATMHACTISACSNLLAQYLDARRSGAPMSLDVVQLLRFVLFTALTAPPNHHWQMFLERSFPSYHPQQQGDVEQGVEMEKAETSPAPSSSSSGTGAVDQTPTKRLNIRNTLIKFFVDCITLGALFNTVAFFALMGLLKGQALGVIAHNVVYETWGVIWLSYKIWPVASLISFAFVPAHWRVVWLSGAGLIYGICLSFVGQRT